MNGRDSYRILKNEATPPMYKIQHDTRFNEYMPPEWEDCLERDSLDDIESVIQTLINAEKANIWHVIG